ncbi:antibiotic biosynthesis monooxygenase family protein [Pleurocapsa sp. FMAR1]|uniref:antibiotic biosynthesis monooxygenase family protein n=1 Tax=Pleurocapsa sp. FMAR1 TaxID=3040204 RepID=UPI0029C90236|nr:antibiotic biosynthesis monooxygenase [Pleurocapsa sp. FMAR1]
MAIVTLINLFSVPQEIEAQFSRSWHKTAEQMKQQPGFIDTKLHRNLKKMGSFSLLM